MTGVYFVLALLGWLSFVVVVVLPLAKAAQRADDELERLRRQEDYREALRRATRRVRGA